MNKIVRFFSLIPFSFFFFLFSFTLLPHHLCANDDNFPELESWKATSEVMQYNPSNLWEYINGAADQFLDYGFRQLGVREFSADAVSVSIDIYDMGTPLNAYGIYTAERPDDYKRENAGAEAVLNLPAQCLMLKDRYYIKVYAFEGKLTRESALELLKNIEKGIAGSDKFPKEIRDLPAENKINGSERYIRESFLGLKELNNCVYAAYRDGEAEYQYFQMLKTKPDMDSTLKIQLAKKWNNTKMDDTIVYYKKIPFQGLVSIVFTKSGIWGVSHIPDMATLLRRMKTFKD
jgi:hypothetical protein